VSNHFGPQQLAPPEHISAPPNILVTIFRVGVVDEVGLVDPSSANSVDAVEVRFFCQINRTGNVSQRHEMRRRLVLPLLTGANMTPANLGRIISGTTLAPTPEEDSSTDVTVHDQNAPVSRVSVVRRALGTVQLMYWLLLFTLGVLMLDAYICELASTQAILVVDSIRPDGQRRRKLELIASGKDNKSEPPKLEYTGLKPVSLEDALSTDTRPRCQRRSSF
jgi:hypothetical protein